MAKLSDHQDDIMQAALLAEEQEKEEAKADTPAAPEAGSSAKPEDAPEQSTDESTEKPKPAEAKDAPEVDPEEETEEEEAEEAAETEEEAKPESKKDAEPEAPKTRKERRKERQEKFLDKIQRESSKKTPSPEIPKVDPLDYTKPEAFSGEDGFIKPEVLAEDREKFGEAKRAEGQAAERFVAEQEKFWDSAVTEKNLLSKDPDFAFLDPESDSYDPDREGRLSEVFLGLAGYQEVPVTNDQGQALADPQTGQPLVRRVVNNTNYSFEKFAREWVADQKRYAEEAVDQTAKNISAQKARSGIRPGGESRKTKTFSAEDIARMSPEELEEHNDAIMAQAADYSESLQ